jgi:hypothetical protein
MITLELSTLIHTLYTSRSLDNQLFSELFTLRGNKVNIITFCVWKTNNSVIHVSKVCELNKNNLILEAIF